MGVKTIAVIGAGTMGRGIAYAAAFGGYSTVHEDVSRHRPIQTGADGVAPEQRVALSGAVGI